MRGVEKEKQPRRVFVEVGTNEIPLPMLGKKAFGENDVYIGIDVERENVELSRERSEEWVKSGARPEIKKMIFTQADMGRLPFADRTVDDLYLGNVFGDPGISLKSKEDFLEEARRVLRDERELIIKENNTPMELDTYFDAQGILVSIGLKDLLKRHGFLINRMMTPEDSDWKIEMDKYHITNLSGDHSYILYAHVKNRI